MKNIRIDSHTDDPLVRTFSSRMSSRYGRTDSDTNPRGNLRGVVGGEVWEMRRVVSLSELLPMVVKRVYTVTSVKENGKSRETGGKGRNEIWGTSLNGFICLRCERGPTCANGGTYQPIFGRRWKRSSSPNSAVEGLMESVGFLEVAFA